jgi:hypothetical protein
MTYRPAQILMLACLFLTACATVRSIEPPASAAALVVQRQLDAYNAHDIEAFAATYSDEVEVYRMPSTAPTTSGKLKLREFYQNSRFNLPKLHAEILHRSVVGNKVVDHERITGLRDEPYETVVVYLVHDGLIHKVWIFNAE